MDPQWLIWLGLGETTQWLKRLWSRSPRRYFTSTYLDLQNTKGSIGVRVVYLWQQIYWGSWLLIIHTRAFRHSYHHLDASNPHYKTRRLIPSWNCQPFGHGGLLNKDPIVRLTAQVWTLDLGFSDETYLLLLFAYNPHWEKPSNSNQLLASRTFEVTHSFHHDQQSQFKTDSRKFGPDRELPYI